MVPQQTDAVAGNNQKSGHVHFFAGFYIFSSKFLLAPIEFRGTANPLEKLIDSLKDQLATRLPEVAWVKCSLTMGIHGSAFFNQPIC